MLTILRDLIAQHGDDLCLVVSFSGGKDSTRMLGVLRENFPSQPTFVLLADTGWEHLDALEWSRQQVRRFGLELHVVRNPNKTFLTMIEQRHAALRATGRASTPPWPSPETRQCTSDLKRGPIETWLRRQVRSGRIPQRVIVNCIGIRAEESDNRAKQNPYQLNSRLMTGKKGKPLTPAAALYGRTIIDFMPIFRDSLEDVLSWHRDRRVPLHPVYIAPYHWDGTTGGYLRRFSCRVCIYSTDSEIAAIYDKDREAFDAIAALEASTGFSMKQGRTLTQIVGRRQTQPEYVAPFAETAQPCLF